MLCVLVVAGPSKFEHYGRLKELALLSSTEPGKDRISPDSLSAWFLFAGMSLYD